MKFDSCRNVRGFTLMEVCVATVVFSIGYLSLDSAIRNVNSQRRLERDQVKSFLCDAAAMERLVASPPPCRDGVIQIKPQVLSQKESLSCPETEIVLRELPGKVSLTLGRVSSRSLGRLLRCR